MARTLIDVWHEGGDAWLAVVFHPRDRETGTARALLFTDAPALYTGASETPPNARFITRLMPTWRLKRALAASGNLTGPSSIESADFEIENGDGSMTFLKGLVWSDQPFEVYLGSPRDPAGDVLAFSDFLRIFSGVTKECRGTSTISVSAVGRKSSLENTLVQDYYRGFGMGVLIPADGASRLVGAPSGDHNVEGAVTIEWVGRLTGEVAFGASVSSGWAPLFMVSNFYGLVLDSDFRLGFVTGETETDESSVQFSGYTAPSGFDLYLAGVVAADGVSVTLYAREGVVTSEERFRPGGLREVGTLTMPVALSKTDAGLGIPVVGRHGSGDDAVSIGQHVYEIRVRAGALAFDDLFAGSERPLPAGGSGVSGLLDAWRFAEGEGTTAISEIDHVDLSLEGSSAWAPSLDADDPAVFPGGPLGQTKPTNFGPVLHFPLTLLDTQSQTYGWRGPDLTRHALGVGYEGSADGVSSDLWGRLRANGAPLVPDETITLGSGSVAVALDDVHTIALSGFDLMTGAHMTAKRLIPGQAAPAREGQRIVVSGDTVNAGTYRVAVDGVSPDGLEIVVEETLVAEVVVAPDELVIRTLEADRQFTYDLANSTAVILADEQAGAFGIDVAGGPEASYPASDLFAVVCDGSVNVDAMVWDPPLALGHLLNANTSRKATLDAIALSAMSWWVEDEDGDFRLITIRPPAGAPTRRFRDEIVSIRSISSTDPFSKITVGHSRNYLVLDPGNIPGSVPANVRARLSADYLYAPRTAAPATLRDFPLAKPRPDPFPTYLIDVANAETWLDYATPMFLEQRLWWEVILTGAWVAAVVRPGDEHEFVYEPPTGAFESGASARVMSVSVEKAADRTILEVVT